MRTARALHPAPGRSLALLATRMVARKRYSARRGARWAVRLKIRWPKGRAGSISAFGIMHTQNEDPRLVPAGGVPLLVDVGTCLGLGGAPPRPRRARRLLIGG